MAAKLGLHLRKAGGRPMLVSADPYRVAAVQQLQTLGRQNDVTVFDGDPNDVPKLARDALAEARRLGSSTVIVDSPGYVQLDEDVIEEIKELETSFQPHETLLVVDAMTGQEAVHVAEEFGNATEISGFVLTKLDGDARGGAALSIRAITGLPIKFVGTGERADALEAFHPDRFAQRILGMGDVLTLIEKAQQSVGEEDMERLSKRMKANQLDLNDFVQQMQRVRSMGPISDLLGMIPGLGSMKRQLQATQIDDTDDLLRAVEGLEDLGAHGTLADSVDELAHHAEVDIGFQQSDSNLAQGLIEVLFGYGAVTGEAAKNALEFVAKRVEHLRSILGDAACSNK
jgi:signal recognition particle subunit SRP54